jgi:peptidoglycan hydrolase-like protein with peptidoglycan-binding domain
VAGSAQRGANSKAVYSRTPARSSKAQAGRRAVAARQPAVYVPQVPSQDRYREIQQALAEKGFFKSEPDGNWNAESVAALKEFQKSQNLDADGRLGALSLIALGLGPKRIVAAQNTPPPSPPEPQPQP